VLDGKERRKKPLRLQEKEVQGKPRFLNLGGRELKERGNFATGK
jgi:hypothetical protein